MSYYLPVDVTIHVTYFEECGYNNQTTTHNYTITKKFTDYNDFMSSIADVLDEETDMLSDSSYNFAGVEFKLNVEFNPHSDGFLPKHEMYNVEPEEYEVTTSPVDPDELLKTMFAD